MNANDLVFITGNQAKADYLAKWLGHTVEHKKVDLDEIQSLDPAEVIEHKVREAYKLVQKPVLVEDVSLSFGAFGGKLPGTYIKWFLTEVGNKGMLNMLKGFTDRSATASILYGLFDGTTLQIFDGTTTGTIAETVRVGEGDGWHGSLSWNSIFIPDGSDKTYAEMTDEELYPFSHRGKAIKKLAAFLAQ
ncbi:MAG: non-canonical purine NTP pyrophosphatase [Candidatus Saccharibacteria bacterium]